MRRRANPVCSKTRVPWALSLEACLGQVEVNEDSILGTAPVCVEAWAEPCGQEPGPSQEFSDQCRILRGDPISPKPKDWPRTFQDPTMVGDSEDNMEFESFWEEDALPPPPPPWYAARSCAWLQLELGRSQSRCICSLVHLSQPFPHRHLVSRN